MILLGIQMALGLQKWYPKVSLLGAFARPIKTQSLLNLVSILIMITNPSEMMIINTMSRPGSPEVSPNELLSYAQLELIARAALPTDRPYILLGESFSGPIAITIAASNPANLIGYVLCASFVRSPFPLLRWLVPFFSFVPAKRLTHRFEQFVLMGRLATPSLRRLHLAAMEKVATATLVARAKAISVG